ncbi:hypothetical protein LCGC14_2470170, partial [marine sediment metagenome]
MARGTKVRCPACGNVFAKELGRRLATLMDQTRPRSRRWPRVCVAVAAALLVGAIGLVAVRHFANRPSNTEDRAESLESARRRELLRSSKTGKPLSPEQLYAAANPAVVRVYVTDTSFDVVGQGSGFFVGP